MNPQEQAQHYYKTAFDRWALELSYEKNHLIAKSIAIYIVEEIIKANPVEWDKTDINSTIGHWEQVLEEINKIRGYERIDAVELLYNIVKKEVDELNKDR
jgi:hypothetical protein